MLRVVQRDEIAAGPDAQPVRKVESMIPDHIEVNVSGGLQIPLPPMARVRQIFDPAKLEDIPGAIRSEFAKPEIRDRVKPGQVIAVGCGSRGVANIALIVRTVIAELKALGAAPFIFPCMGSHGAATAEGQRKVLEAYGITEESTGVPIRATMDTVITGHLDDGTPVHMDRHAAEAEAIVVINRIKPHTAFRGATESGLTKMLAIGIGKIIGASTYHMHGMDSFPELLPKVRDVNITQRNVLFGVGIVENAYDETALIELVPADQLAAREPALQVLAKKNMPQIFFDEIDVLVIDEMGKNISGAGFDPNWTSIAIFIVMVGGIGSIEGPLIGALLYFAADRLFSRYGATYMVVLGLMTLCMALFARTGLWGLWTRRVDAPWFPVRRRLVKRTPA